MGGIWDFPCVTCVMEFIVRIIDHSYNFLSLVVHEDMTNFHGGGCCDPLVLLHNVMYFCIMVGLRTDSVLHICGFMNLHLKYMG